MGAYLRRRLIASVMTLLVSTFLVFSSLYLAGDPITALSRGRTIAPEMETALREQYRLDDPFFLRYIAWLGDLLRGDLGNSLMYSDQVTNVIGQRMGVTFELSVYAAAIIAVIGVGSGIIAGLRRGFADTAILTSTTVLMAVPPFVTAIVLLGVFSVALGWFPTRGAGDGYPERIWYLTLPAVALAVASLSVVSRVTRTSVRQEMGREHVQTAVSRGIPPGPTTRRHVIRNAMIPVTTVMGLTIASLIALTAIVEQAFGINGLGSALVQAASYNDFPVVQGIAVIYVLIFVVINTIIDVSYGLLDPRVRFGGGA
ncbi:ABC transporter permease [Leucobacter sp. wl10]|nr:ABC transporter permease [Leucobacter sp. wl10]